MNTSPTSWPPNTPESAGVLVSRRDIPPGVSVMVRDGHITLEGVVGWHYERVRSAWAMKQLHGVKSVFNNIMVEPGRCALASGATHAFTFRARSRREG